MSLEIRIQRICDTATYHHAVLHTQCTENQVRINIFILEKGRIAVLYCVKKEGKQKVQF